MTTSAHTATSSSQGLNSRLPTEAEAKSASEAAAAIAKAMELDDGLVVPGPKGGSIKISPVLCELIIELLEYVSTGKMVTLAPFGAELTTQQAADILNVSRMHLNKLLTRGDIEYVEFGNHRLVLLSELIRFRDEREQKQEETMMELSRLGQEFDLA